MEINSTSQNQLQTRGEQLDNKNAKKTVLTQSTTNKDKKSSILDNPNFFDNINNAKVHSNSSAIRNSNNVVNTQNNTTFVGILNTGNMNPNDNNQIVKNPSYVSHNQGFVATNTSNLVNQNLNTISSNSILTTTNQAKKKPELTTKTFKSTKIGNNEVKSNIDIQKISKITNRLLVEKSSNNKDLDKSNEYQLKNPNQILQNVNSHSERSSTIPKNNQDCSTTIIVSDHSMEALTTTSVLNQPQPEASEMPRNNNLEQKQIGQRAVSNNNNRRPNPDATKKKRDDRKSNFEKKDGKDIRCHETVIRVNVTQVNFFL